MKCFSLVHLAYIGVFALALPSCKKGTGTVEFAVTASPPITGVSLLRGTVTVGARTDNLEIVPKQKPASIGAVSSEEAVFALSLPADDGDMVTVDLAAYGMPAAPSLAEGSVTTAFSGGGTQPKRVELRLGPPGSVVRADMGIASAPDMPSFIPTTCNVVPSGSFSMGASDLGNDAAPLHQVTLSSFCIEETEVTVSAYGLCVGAGKCTPPDGTGVSPDCNWMVPGRENHPVNCVDWTQANAYCQWEGAALPTEAQWEYAARYDSNQNDNDRDYPWGNDAPTPAGQAGPQACWNMSHTCVVGSFRSSSVGASQTSESWLDLQDMSGNVWEWVHDYYSQTYYGEVAGAGPDPTGPTQGSLRVTRGGSWSSTNAGDLRTASRLGDDPTNRRPRTGFRCARPM